MKTGQTYSLRTDPFTAFHKPYGVLCQFTQDGSPNRTLADFKLPKAVYAIWTA